jgi:tetratricopeptide (TPR) repeat protein
MEAHSLAEFDHDATDRAGVALCGLRIASELNYIFREQLTSDYGVDGHVETKEVNVPTGRLIGVQIKTGSSHFGEERDEGWVFRPKRRHITYWLAHSLPMYLLLVDLDTKEIYWQVLDESTIVTGERSGRYVFVPKAHMFSTVSSYWEQSATVVGLHARDRYEDNLKHLAPSVARKIRQREGSSPIAAAWLAAFLAQSRTAPMLAVRTLLTNRPIWLEELDTDGWIAVSNYALYHELGPEAAEAFDVARIHDPARSGQFNFSAGIAVLEDNPDRATQYFSGAKQSHDAPQLGSLGLAIARLRRGEAAPINAALEETFSTADDHASILMFRADRSAAAGESDAAIALLDRALAVDPDNDRILTALAVELHKRAQTSSRRSDDIPRAINLAKAAVDQLHRCAGSSVHALTVLLHILLSQRSFSEVLDRALAPPVGQATPEEVSSSEVVTAAALAADELGLEDVVEQLVERLDDKIQRGFVRASLARSEGLAAVERRRMWEQVVETLDSSRPRELLIGVTRLAHFGIDRTADLDCLVRAHVIPAEKLVLIRAVAIAVSDPDKGLPALRALADADHSAAQSLVQVLVHADRANEAIHVASEAAKRLREPRFYLMQAEMLFSQDRYIEAREVIESALVSPSLSDSMRPDTHAMLARVAARSQDWDRIEQHCEAALKDTPPATRSRFLAWLLVESQVRQRAHVRAIETVEKLRLEPETPGETRVWAAAITSRPLTEATATRMLDLAEQFASDNSLSSDLLTTVISRTRDDGDSGLAGPHDERTPISDTLRRRAFEAIESHIDAHGEASQIRRIRFSAVDDLVDVLREQLEPVQRSLREIADQVLQGKLPLGLLGSAASRSVAYMYATKALGLYIASSFLESDCASDMSGAQLALDCDVVVDISALMVAGLIGNFASLRGQFRDLLLPQACINDVDIARGEIDGLTASSGHLSWDTQQDRPTYTAPDVDQQLESIRRLTLLQSSLSHTLATQVDELPTFADIIGDDGREAAWLAPIELAKSRGLVLWSDDVAVRKLARSLGVNAFGTMSLLEVLANKAVSDIADDDQPSINQLIVRRRGEVTRAINARVVDVPVEIRQLIDEATKARFPVDLAQCTIGRAAWWVWSTSRYEEIDMLLTAITDPATADIWRAIAMDGAASLSPWSPSEAGGLVVLAAIAARGTSPNPSELAASIKVGEQIAARHKASSPLTLFPDVTFALETMDLISDAAGLVSAVIAELNAAG